MREREKEKERERKIDKEKEGIIEEKIEKVFILWRGRGKQRKT
mgnify:CR=1 FL=1